MTDRDYFAAAALSGMLADGGSTWGTGSREDYCRIAYEWADDMARERERSNIFRAALGAACAPHADGEGDTPRCPDAPPGVTQPDNGLATSGRGHHTQQPVAWAVVVPVGNGRFAIDDFFVGKQCADEACHQRMKHTQRGAEVMPLYRTPQPTLTDEEREAIVAGLGALERLYEDSLPISQPIYEQHAPTLRALLERLR